jgi:hypothetical protein
MQIDFAGGKRVVKVTQAELRALDSVAGLLRELATQSPDQYAHLKELGEAIAVVRQELTPVRKPGGADPVPTTPVAPEDLPI